MSHALSRRSMLRLTAVGLGGAALAACGATPTPTKVPPTATKAPVTGATQAPAAAPAATPKPAGPMPKVNIWSNFQALARPEGSHPERLEAVKKYIMEAVGVEPIHNIPPTGTAAAERLNLLLASKSEELDVFQGSWTDYREAIIPITDLVQKEGPDLWRLHQGRWPLATDTEGKIWGVPRQAPQLFTQPICVRTDWLKELSLSQPKTLEELEKVIEAFRKKDPGAVLLTSSLNDLRQATVGGFTQFGYSNWLDSRDNKIKPAELQPDYQDWVAKMADWYQKGVLYKESFAAHNDGDVAKGGKVGVFAGWYSRVTLQFTQTIPTVTYDWEKSGVKGPKGLMATFSPGNTTAAMITKKAKDPAACMKLINWQYKDQENNVTASVGIKGVDWEWDEAANKDQPRKFYIKRLVDQKATGAKVYAGEFFVSTSGGSIGYVFYGPSDPQQRLHYEYLRDWAYNLDAPAKKRVDADVPYDLPKIRTKLPNLADITRLLDEETTKFITGARPVSEWNAFLDQLNKAGMNDWIAAYTEQYSQLKK